MSEEAVVYLNGAYLKGKDAHISLFDRGLLFGDGVYEVIPVYQGKVFFEKEHIARLNKNLLHTKICHPIGELADWSSIFNRLIEDNGGGDLQIYLQITRGNQWARKHDIPKSITPTVFAFTLHTPYATDSFKKNGLRACVLEDYRWGHCDIKSTSLLPTILLNDEALTSGADTALLVRDGYLTEGCASNVFIVDDLNIVRTPPLTTFCLPGITRDITLKLLQQLNLAYEVLPIKKESLYQAKEIWITSTTKEIYPVTVLDNQPIGLGAPGPLWDVMNQAYHALIQSSL